MLSPLSKLILLTLIVCLNGKVYQTVTMFRHGSRYFLNKYYDWNDTFWGELSATGMRNHQRLGQLLRKDYIDRHIIPEIYNQNEVQFYTTNANRTFTSALSQLYAMYPLGKGPKLPTVDKKYHLPPYSYETDSSEQQFALPKGYQPVPVTMNTSVLLGSCPRFTAEADKNQNMQLSVYKEMNATYYPFMKKMADLFNFTTVNLSSITGLHDALIVDKYLGNPMPANLSDADYQNIRHLSTWYDIFRINFDIARAYSTNVIKRVLEDFDDRINNLNTKVLKLTALSAHDTNINCLLNYFNISSAACMEQLWRKNKTTSLNCETGPQFASNLIIELQSDNDKDFYVKVRYNGKYVYLCEKKSVTCDYKEWKVRAQKIMIPNAHEVCNGNSEQPDSLVQQTPDTVEI